MATANGVLDLRDYDWATFNPSQFGVREHERFRVAIEALQDPDVAEATYRLANSGACVTPSNWWKAPEASWLLTAFAAAVALGRIDRS